jgi:uncharacterized protein (DUF433 family)
MAHQNKFGTTTQERFLNKVRKTNGCWIWTGAKNADGYGLLYFNGRHWSAHRYSWFLVHGFLPDSKAGDKRVVMHSCDNPTCVNPSHLSLGSRRENTRDMIRKGRIRPSPGERNGRALLTEADVRNIIIERETGARIAAIAARYGVGHRAVEKILSGRSWRHLHRKIEAAK